MKRLHLVEKVDSNENIQTESQREKNNILSAQQHGQKVTTTTLQDHQVPLFLREPFITSGYRDTDNITVRQCLASLFTIHNETFNIWSHLIAAVAFLWCCLGEILEQETLGNPLVYPIVCYTIVTVMMFMSSSFAHLFSCMSWRVRNACFYVDYASISIFSLTAGQGFVFYCRPLSDNCPFFYRFPHIFLAISFSFSCFNMVLNCLSRHRFRKHRFLIRTGVYAVKYIFDISPIWSRCFVYGTCDSTVLSLFQLFLASFFISAITNASRLPERLFPGRFDLLGYSHHFLHIFGSFGNYYAFKIMLTDMTDRKEHLLASPYPPTFFTTFGLLMILMIFDGFVVVWFVRKWLTAEEEELFSGSKYLVGHKKDIETDNYLNNQIATTKKGQ